MKSENEVLRMLQDCEDELRYAKEWMENARKSYDKDRAMFGSEADNGELLTAKDNYYSVKKQMELLMNILEIPQEA